MASGNLPVATMSPYVSLRRGRQIAMMLTGSLNCYRCIIGELLLAIFGLKNITNDYPQRLWIGIADSDLLCCIESFSGQRLFSLKALLFIVVNNAFENSGKLAGSIHIEVVRVIEIADLKRRVGTEIMVVYQRMTLE